MGTPKFEGTKSERNPRAEGPAWSPAFRRRSARHRDDREIIQHGCFHRLKPGLQAGQLTPQSVRKFLRDATMLAIGSASKYLAMPGVGRSL